MLDRNGFEDLNDLRKEGVGNFRNDKTENPAAPRNQSPRLRIRIVAQFLDDAPDALGQRRIDGGNPVDGAGTVAVETLARFAISRISITT